MGGAKVTQSFCESAIRDVNTRLGKCVEDDRRSIQCVGGIVAQQAAGTAGGAAVRVSRGGVRMMMMVVMATDRLRQILDVGKLATLRGVRKVGGELVELVGGGYIAV